MCDQSPNTPTLAAQLSALKDLPTSNDTKLWRMRAHAAFDRLWQELWWSRSEAYADLAEHMGLPLDETHFAQFTAKQCHTAWLWARERWDEAMPEVAAEVDAMRSWLTSEDIF